MTTLRSFPRSGNLETIGPALLYVNVSWCSHCKKTRPIMEQVSGMLGRTVPVYSIDGDERTDLVAALAVDGFPTIVYVDGGGGKHKYTGDRTANAITNGIQRMRKAGYT